MLGHSRGIPGRKKLAFNFGDFKVEFFVAQPTSAYQEADHLLEAQMARIRAREQAQDLSLIHI